ncbi:MULTISPECIES: competence type IV pilus major pilin ComGC [Vagococcus]|uniref:competence type IV pilus major pilin ComGC n=1 Tax=Vagococcus TaxID=2737 RepID=UPI002FCAB63C
MKKNKKKNQGFTLIEMLIVLFVIAVLMVLFVPNLVKQTTHINEQGDAALTKVIETQCEMYYLDNNQRPGSLDDLYEGDYISEEQKEKATDIGISVK